MTDSDTKQAIPSPEDRVRAIKEREQKATKGPWLVRRRHASADRCDGIEAHIGHTHPPEQSCWDVDECPGQEAEMIVQTDGGFYGPNADDADFIAHARADIPYLLSLVEELIPFCDSPCGHTSQYAYSEDGGKNIVCLICEREELKGQAVTASQQPRCPECLNKTVVLMLIGGNLVVGCPKLHQQVIEQFECDGNPPTWPLEDFAQFFAAAPSNEVALLRKRKDYHAEYVDAVEAAEKAQGELGVMREALRPFTECQPPYDHDNECSFCMTPEGQEHPPECSWMIARAALTPEPASQAAEEKK